MKPLMMAIIGGAQLVVGSAVFWVWASFSMIYLDGREHAAELRWCSYWIYGGLIVAACGILLLVSSVALAIACRFRRAACH